MRTSSSRLFPFLFTFAWLFPLIKVLYIILILIWSFCLFFQISFFLFFSVSIGRSHIKTLGSVKCIFYVSLTSVFSCLLRTKGIDHLIEWTGSHSSILCLLVSLSPLSDVALPRSQCAILKDVSIPQCRRSFRTRMHSCTFRWSLFDIQKRRGTQLGYTNHDGNRAPQLRIHMLCN